VAALEYLAVAIHNYHESGSTGMLHVPVAILATLLDRLGRYEPAATIAGFASGQSHGSYDLPELGTAITASARSLANRHTSRFARRARR